MSDKKIFPMPGALPHKTGKRGGITHPRSRAIGMVRFFLPRLERFHFEIARRTRSERPRSVSFMFYDFAAL
jgi:hypothetical protein